MKLAIGAAQFGLDYGVANATGLVHEREVKSILDFGKSQGIELIDTAIAYGISENVLGGMCLDSWNIVTKLPGIPSTVRNCEEWASEQVLASLSRLKIKSLYSLLLHRPSDLLSESGNRLYKRLDFLKREGLVKKIGISIYSLTNLDEILKRFNIDVIQIPVNIFDRSLETSGWGERLDDMGIEIHARSIFLQGLLLLNPLNRPSKFKKWEPDFKRYDKWLSENNVSPLQANLSYVNQLKFVKKIIVGVDRKEHLEEIVNSILPDTLDIPILFQNKDLRLINPSEWKNI